MQAARHPVCRREKFSMSAATGARSRRTGLYVPFVLLLLAVVGWTGLWLYGRHRVGQELDAFFARQASIGRVWSCPDRSIGGYPFRIDLACVKPSFATVRRGQSDVMGRMERLTVTAQTAGAFNLAHVVAIFEGPLTLTEPGFGRTTVTWKQALASYRGHHRRLERASVDLKDVIILAEPVNGERMELKAASLEAHVREGVVAAEPGSYDVAVRLNGAVIPPLDGLLRSNDPLTLLLDGKLLNLGQIDRRDWRVTVENWRQARGIFRVEQFNLAKGVPRLEAKGDLRLDDLRRLEGRLDANFVNAGPLLQQFGVNIGGGAAGALLGGLLGGGRQQPGETSRDRALRLPLSLGDGRVAVGPFRIPGLVLNPLY
jgi:hypothetical protein